jgi:hypothetical protein
MSRRVHRSEETIGGGADRGVEHVERNNLSWWLSFGYLRMSVYADHH